MGCVSSYTENENIEEKKFQDLSGWSNITLDDLLHKLMKEKNVDVRIYTVATTKRENQVVRHTGSGPNLEGGLASLCTCKHSMRQYHTTDDWIGKWILGLSSRAKNNGFDGKHYLFYMMKVEKAFESHAELYNYLAAKNSSALRIKSAVHNRLGDIFEPESHCKNPLDPSMYKTPHPYHSHGKNGSTDWYHDIIYNNKSAPLLLGDVDNTFVWTEPMIIFDRPRGVGSMKLSIGEDLFRLLKTY